MSCNQRKKLPFKAKYEGTAITDLHSSILLAARRNFRPRKNQIEPQSSALDQSV